MFDMDVSPSAFAASCLCVKQQRFEGEDEQERSLPATLQQGKKGEASFSANCRMLDA
jgi:hypothetical protein